MEVLEQVGAYAGLASIVGLAVLSALYFSQARDLRRLREWAGRAPDRAPAPVVPPAAAPAPKPAQQTAQQTAVVPVPAGAAQAPAEPGTAKGAPAPAPAAGSAPATGNGQGGGPPSLPRVPGPHPPRPGEATAAPGLLGGAAPARPPWYRRLAPRYVALAVAGLLVVGAGAAYALGALDGLTSPEGGAPAPGPAAKQGDAACDPPTRRSGGASAPSSVTFAVLNGTQVEGLAKQIADKLEAAGYRRGNVTNATEQQKAESAVLYASGARRDAAAVARRLDISQIEPVDPASQSLAGDASVVVIVGGDQTP